MKKKIILGITIVALLTVTGCGKSSSVKETSNTKETSNSNETSNTKKEESNNVTYTCIKEGESTGGGKRITKLVYTLTKDNYTVSYQIINDDTCDDKEVYNNSKAATEKNVKEHNEKYADKYEWTLQTDDSAQRIISTRRYDMSKVRSSEGHKYESEYKFYKEDGTFDIEAWMKYKKDNDKYTCSKN